MVDPENISKKQLNDLLESVLPMLGIQGALFSTVEPRSGYLLPDFSWKIPLAPFIGNEKEHLISFILDCKSKHAKPHIHNVKALAISNVVKRLSGCSISHRALYYPFSCENQFYIFVGMISPDSAIEFPKINSNQQLKTIFSLYHNLTQLNYLQGQLAVMEIFAREVGHDISSQVQASVSKLSLITTKKATGELAIRKALEAIEEIWAMYRSSEHLGLTVDRNFQLRERRDFDLIDVLEQVRQHYQSEAHERHINIKIVSNLTSIKFYGDKRAMEIGIGQILMNAIKYAVGNSEITVKAHLDEKCPVISIRNHSSIDLPEDKLLLFKFGWRSDEAKELHVNGSGVGLFTAKKIIEAHLGYIDAIQRINRSVEFTVVLPDYFKIVASYSN